MKTFKQFLAEAKQLKGMWTTRNKDDNPSYFETKDGNIVIANSPNTTKGWVVCFMDKQGNCLGEKKFGNNKDQAIDYANELVDKSAKQSLKQVLKEADLGIVEPGLDKNDDEPYNTPLVKISESKKRKK